MGFSELHPSAILRLNLMDIEDYVVEVMRGERKAPLLRPALSALSRVYRSVIAVRNAAYDKHIFK